MMKTKIILVGLLLCFVAACDTNSPDHEKYNPHLDGYYWRTNTGDIVHGGNYFRTIYLHINYPFLHACSLSYTKGVRGPDKKSPIRWLSNVHAKIVHLKGNDYKAHKINRNTVKDENITYKMEKDNVGLHFSEFKDGESNGITTLFRYGNSPSKDYLKCINNAKKTLLIFQPLP